MNNGLRDTFCPSRGCKGEIWEQAGLPNPVTRWSTYRGRGAGDGEMLGFCASISGRMDVFFFLSSSIPFLIFLFHLFLVM